MENKIGGRIEVEAKHLLNAYGAIEKARRELYWALNYQIRAGEKPNNLLPSDNVEVEILDNGKVVKLTVMDYPARLQSTKNEEKERWINNVMFALKNVKDKISFDRIFVFVKFYFPVSNVDVDNRDIKPIIDGIKYSRIVADDNYRYVSYGFNANFSDSPRTEIYIIDYKVFPKKLHEILNET